ncbi:MAG: MFS transporter [Burkholderiales bacterium]|uniref:MFS transporter n=1 Tax=Ottowia pentelensis TaxID=511108 RepID=A0ABV6PPF7_9BURK|nr:MFS transporter [Ottowia sp.]MBN9405054.1 MFS transporter [Burkholderiales bacterium]MBS0404106.1 MFS transporter [Pseudomonadota bacterium]HMN56708.1 MFS transporter [Ottowia sp.]
MWLKETNPEERKTLLAAFLGYGVDAFDYMIYTFMIPTLIALWGMTKAQAGYIATGALITSAIGGWLAGILADRYGRVRMLQITVLWFSAFTFLSGFTHSPEQLFVTRALQGLGFGGEWSVGSVLIAEMISARHRGKAVGLVQSAWAIGWGISALAFWVVYALFEPAMAWRVLFWLGVLPALLILYIRRQISDPQVFKDTQAKLAASGQRSNFLLIFKPGILRITVLASLLATGMQGAYYAVTTWLPTYLKMERNLSVLNTSGYLIVLIAGSFAGYLTSAWLSDRLGRRNCFMLFALCAGVLVVFYTQLPITDAAMMVLGFPLGFFLSGIFSGMGAFLSELYPSDIRGSGQGFCYNFGRAVGSIFPAVVGIMSSSMSLGVAIGYMAAGAYLLVIIASLLLPETRGRELTDVTATA